MTNCFIPNSLYSEDSTCSQKTIICLTGPTAAGKSATILALAKRWPIEIINVDSATIYCSMDIGTAKPSVHEQSLVSHHLLDIRDPAQSYCVADFCKDAHELMNAIHQRGHIPVLVGGSMMYFKALREGINDLPSASAQIRAALQIKADQEGWPSLHAELMRFDPVTAARLSPEDSQRIQRAIEIYQISNKPMSVWLKESQSHNGQGDIKDLYPKKHYLTLSLEPSDRAALHQRITVRFDQMLAQGLYDEAAMLFNRGDLHPHLPSMRCVGYRQLWQHLNQEIDYVQARLQALVATRQLAKRQLTWLRAQPQRYIVDCLAKQATEKVVDLFAQFA